MASRVAASGGALQEEDASPDVESSLTGELDPLLRFIGDSSGALEAAYVAAHERGGGSGARLRECPFAGGASANAVYPLPPRWSRMITLSGRGMAAGCDAVSPAGSAGSDFFFCGDAPGDPADAGERAGSARARGGVDFGSGAPEGGDWAAAPLRAAAAACEKANGSSLPGA